MGDVSKTNKPTVELIEGSWRIKGSDGVLWKPKYKSREAAVRAMFAMKTNVLKYPKKSIKDDSNSWWENSK